MHILLRIIVVGVIGGGLICYCQEVMERVTVTPLKKVESSLPVASLTPKPIISKQAAPSPKSTITLNNKLTTEKLGYKHWGVTYRPTTFKLYVDDELVSEYDYGNDKFTKHIQTIKLSPAKDTIKIRHVHDWYYFGQSRRKGDLHKEIKIDPDTEIVDLEFDWCLQEPGQEHIKLIQNKPRAEDKKETPEKTATIEATA